MTPPTKNKGGRPKGPRATPEALAAIVAQTKEAVAKAPGSPGKPTVVYVPTQPPKPERPAPVELTAPKDDSTLARLDAVIADYQQQLRCATTAADQAKFQAGLLKALTERHAIEQAEAVTEDKVTRHPRVIALRDAILAALKDYPEALAAVVAALEDV